MTTEKIEPCPYCNQKCEGVQYGDFYLVFCIDENVCQYQGTRRTQAEAISAHNTLARSARAVEVIAEKLTVMFCSAEASEGPDGFVSGYYIRTGAIHSIVGMLDGLGHTVLMPSDMPKPKAEEAVAVAEEALDAVYFAHFVDEHHPETDEQRIAKTALAKIDALTNTKDTDNADRT